MAALSSKATQIPPLLPWPVDFTENHNSELKLTPWSLQKGAIDQLPIRFIAPLPCESPVRSKHDIAWRNNRRKKGESFETIVGSCISRAVAFSNHQFRAILKSFSYSSVRKNSGVLDIRCYNAGKTYSNGPINNNGNGDGGDRGGSGGSEVGFPSGGKSGGGGGGNYTVMGANWWRWKCQSCTSVGRSVLVTVANQQQLYQHTTTREWVVGSMMHVAITRALTDPAVVEIIQEIIALPFVLLLMGPGIEEAIVQVVTATLGAGSIATAALLWLLWRWWRSRGLGVDKGEDEDEDAT